MSPDRAIERLDAYRSELDAIHSRFRSTPSGAVPYPGDQARLHLITIEVTDLCVDLFGQPNRYSSMAEAGYDNGLSSFTNTSSRGSVEVLAGVVSAAATRVRENPSVLRREDAATSQTQAVAPPPLPTPLPVPEKVTVHWLLKNVPVGMWATLGGIVLAAFVIGVTAAVKLSVMQQWYDVVCGPAPKH